MANWIYLVSSACRSEEGVVCESEVGYNNFSNGFFFNYNFFGSGFFCYSFFCSSFFSYSFFCSSFFCYNFFGSGFFCYNFFCSSFFNYRCGNEKSKESSNCFIGKFDTVNQSSSLEGFCSDFNTAFKDSGNHFGSESDAIGCSESNYSVNINNSSSFCSNGVFCSNFFNYLTCFFGDRHNSSFFREYSGSHSSTHKSCENERKSFLHFRKIAS